VDVQDPTFFMDEEEYTALEETLEEMLENYGENLRMAKYKEGTILQDHNRTWSS